MSGGLWFTADPHIGHRRLTEIRGFGDDTAAHDAALAANWDARVRPEDTVWVLGDLTLGPLHNALMWFVARPGRLRLILGNHDAGHPMHRTAHKDQHRYLDVFEYVATSARIRILGGDVLLSHFPYPGTSEGTDENGRPFDDRYLQYRLPNLGMPLIHGHTHRAEKLSWNRNARAMTPQFHVGLDAWDLAPVALHDLEDLITDTLIKGI